MSIKHETAAGIITFKLTDEYTEILLLDNGEFWGFPKGKSKENETVQSTAIREFQEETSMTPLIISLEPLSVITYKFYRKAQEIEKTVHLFACIVDYESEVILSDEHVDYNWVHWRQAMKMLPYKTLKDALSAGIEWLSSHDYAVEKLARNLEDLR